jgi:tetratricopeptide (TPR) repeat protein
MQQFRAQAFASALKDLDLCVRVDPQGRHAALAHYHAALSLDQLGRLEAALQRFCAVLELSAQDTPMTRDANQRVLRLACHLGRWELVRTYGERLLAARPPPVSLQAILAHGALALEAVARGDDMRAEYHVGHARNEIERLGLDSPGKIPRDVGMVYFALGEIRRLRAERTRLEYAADFAAQLERRCELILAAQAGYSDAMRAFDAHWSTMAGYRVGGLYASLHHELMQIPPPPAARDEAQHQLFEGAMRLRYSVLVEKALNMLQHTLTMADRTGESSEWVSRARSLKAELEQRLKQEDAAIEALPFSREALEAALKRLSDASSPKP